MEKTSLQALLREDEDRLLHTLRASESIEKSRDKSVETLSEELSSLLLRYNAACAPDRMRQALADCLAATARDSIMLLKAGGADKEVSRRESSGWAALLLMLAAAAAAACVLLLERLRPVGVGCAAAAVILAFLAGRLWFRERSVSVRATLDPDVLMLGMKRVGETMDRKIDVFCERAGEWSAETKPGGEAPLGEEELRLFGDLLEALYADSGDFALRQLNKIRPCLRSLGLALADYSGDNAELFEVLPSRNAGTTLRPAILAGDRLLLAGRATEQSD